MAGSAEFQQLIDQHQQIAQEAKKHQQALKEAKDLVDSNKRRKVHERYLKGIGAATARQIGHLRVLEAAGVIGLIEDVTQTHWVVNPESPAKHSFVPNDNRTEPDYWHGGDDWRVECQDPIYDGDSETWDDTIYLFCRTPERWTGDHGMRRLKEVGIVYSPISRRLTLAGSEEVLRVSLPVEPLSEGARSLIRFSAAQAFAAPLLKEKSSHSLGYGHFPGSRDLRY